jgi:hypothetical protein
MKPLNPQQIIMARAMELKAASAKPTRMKKHNPMRGVNKRLLAAATRMRCNAEREYLYELGIEHRFEEADAINHFAHLPTVQDFAYQLIRKAQQA